MRITLLIVILLPVALASIEPKPQELFSKIGSLLKGIVRKKSTKGVPFCKGLECPEFSVPFQKDEYELRCYNATNWVTTSGPLSGWSFSSESRKLFTRLFEYISGENKQKTKIEMTVPVRIQRPLNTAVPASDQKMTMSFWIPSEFQASPPKPSSKLVKISTEKTRCFYVHSFGGYILFKWQYMKALNKLQGFLQRDQLADQYDDSFFIYSGYDNPATLFGRHNEVWLEHK